MREGQLALRAGAASGVLVPVADNRVTLVLDQIKIVGNDFLDRPAEAAKIALLPGAKLSWPRRRSGFSSRLQRDRKSHVPGL